MCPTVDILYSKKRWLSISALFFVGGGGCGGGWGALPFATNGRLFALVYLMLKTSLGIYGLNKHAIGQKKEEERENERQTDSQRQTGRERRDGEKKGTNHFVIASVMKSADMSHQGHFFSATSSSFLAETTTA